MKKMVFAAVSMVVTAVFAEPVTVSTVDELVSELSACDGETPKTIILAEGDYQLTSAQAYQSSSWGVSHLLIPSNVTLRGAGEKPENTRLIGDGATCRILQLQSGCIVDNLTLTNGVTSGSEDKPSRGAAVAGDGGVVTNCVLIGNYAKGAGGAVTSSSKTNGIILERCKVLNNTGTTGGGVHSVRCYGCLIAGNSSRTGEGGGGYGSMLIDCVVSNNSTIASKSGGGLCDSSATGTLFVNNIAKQRGGGVASSGDSGFSGVYSNCTFVGNSGKYGGAANRVILLDCEIKYNAASSNGGGTYSCSNVNCTVSGNFATTYGGGLYLGIVQNTVISNNFSKNTGPNTYDADMFDCVIYGMAAAGGSATRCVFTGIGDVQSLTQNQYWSTNQASTYAYYNYPNATNCLFVGNRLTSSSSALFCGVQVANKSSSAVNCTVVSNTYNYLVRYCRDETYPMTFMNTVIYGNRNYLDTIDRDIHIATSGDNRCEVGALIFDHCAYKTKTSTLDLAEYILDDSLYCFGEDGFGADPKFVLAKDAVHPYSLRLSSPLIGRGRVCDWMTGAYDIRGEEDDGKYLRVRDGKVDIGCYQCWLNPVGMTVVVR
jgi:hypothetical protein